MSTSSLSILVVSPSEAARRLLQLLFERMGHHCESAEDADDLLELVVTGKPAMVVVDARAQEEDTLFLLGLLQKRYPTLPRLTLHNAQMQLSAPGIDRSFRVGGGATHLAFPSQSELEHVLALVAADRMLTMLKPPTAKA